MYMSLYFQISHNQHSKEYVTMAPPRRLIKHKRFFRNCCNPRKCVEFLDNASTQEMDSLSEIAKNVLNGNVPLHKQAVDRLRPKKALLQKLASKAISRKKKKQLLQTGSGLPLIPILASIASGVLSSYLNG